MGPTDRRFIRRACGTLALVFFAGNHAGILAGWARTPEGYQPLWLSRGTDLAQYMTWAEAFRTAWLIPNYHAPWATEAAFFNPIFAATARVSAWTGLPYLLVYHAAHLGAMMLCGYGLYRCLVAFLETRGQALAAMIVALSSVPLASLYATTSLVTGDRPGGLDGFLHYGHDAFLHGIPGSLPTALGTGLCLLSFALLAEYLRGGSLWPVLAATSAGAFLHPFEVFVVVAAGSAVLLIRRDVKAAVLLAAFAALGVVPYLLQALTTEWIAAAGRGNIFWPGNPLRVLSALGVPTLFALAVMPFYRSTEPRATLLHTWVLAVLVLIYVPLPWTQHLFDGYHYAIGMLVAVQLAGLGTLRIGLVRRAAYGIAALSLLCYPVYWWAAAEAGPSTGEAHHSPTIIADDDVALIAWMRQAAHPTDVVLAPEGIASWLATVPMRSVASHYVFSITHSEQAAYRDSVLAGSMPPGRYGERFVISEGAIEGYSRMATVGQWVVWERPRDPREASRPRGRFRRPVR